MNEAFFRSPAHFSVASFTLATGRKLSSFIHHVAHDVSQSTLKVENKLKEVISHTNLHHLHHGLHGDAEDKISILNEEETDCGVSVSSKSGKGKMFFIGHHDEEDDEFEESLLGEATKPHFKWKVSERIMPIYRFKPVKLSWKVSLLWSQSQVKLSQATCYRRRSLKIVLVQKKFRFRDLNKETFLWSNLGLVTRFLFSCLNIFVIQKIVSCLINSLLPSQQEFCVRRLHFSNRTQDLPSVVRVSCWKSRSSKH